MQAILAIGIVFETLIEFLVFAHQVWGITAEVLDGRSREARFQGSHDPAEIVQVALHRRQVVAQALGNLGGLQTAQVEADDLVLVAGSWTDIVVETAGGDIITLTAIGSQDALHGSPAEVEQAAEVFLGQQGSLLVSFETQAADQEAL